MVFFSFPSSSLVFFDALRPVIRPGQPIITARAGLCLNPLSPYSAPRERQLVVQRAPKPQWRLLWGRRRWRRLDSGSTVGAVGQQGLG